MKGVITIPVATSPELRHQEKLGFLRQVTASKQSQQILR
jgi:hypothetical protein